MTPPDETPPEEEARDELHLKLELPMHVIDRVDCVDRVDRATARMAEQKRWNDRRRHPRFAVSIMSYCQIDGVKGETSCAVGDMSLGGLSLKLDAPSLQLGACVRIAMELPYIDGRRICSLVGRVVRVLRDEGGAVSGAGVQFEQQERSPDHDLLAGFLELWADRPAR